MTFFVSAFGYRMDVLDAAKLALTRLVCRHEAMQFNAATCAQPIGSGSNVEVGVVVRCEKCRKTWVGNVVAGSHKKH